MKYNLTLLNVIAAGMLAAPIADAQWLKVFDADDWEVTADEADLQAHGWIFQDWDFVGYPACIDGTRDCTGVREVVPAPYGGKGNAVMIRGGDPNVVDPANSRPISAFPLPQTIPLGGTATFYLKFAAGGVGLGAHFGLTATTAPTNDSGDTGARHDYPNLATSAQVTLYERSTLGVYHGFWSDATLDPELILETETWYELWYHITHAPSSEGGGYFELYIRGGAFGDGEPYHLKNPYDQPFTEWSFREVADAPLARFLNVQPAGNPATNVPRTDPFYFDDMYLLLDEFSLEAPGDGDVITHESLWSSLEDYDGWKPGGIGWLYDGFYPWIYHGTAGWLYVSPEGATLDSMYIFNLETGSWLWSSDSFSGWYYDYSSNSWGSF